MTIGDWLKLGLFFVALIGFFVIVIGGVMRLETWRAGRGLAAFARALPGTTAVPATMPGRWKLDELRAQVAGCDVALRPIELRNAHGPRTIALELRVRGGASPQRGTLQVKDGALLPIGVPAPRDAAPLTAALASSRVTVELADGAATAGFAFPLSRANGRRAAALAIALASYLTDAAPAA
ncbi:MAG: hypothetical protein K8W52_24545 [Deltaproteobacteria bacterium]|nr:hypothetical protein [Deltaproteobacteria bacterium]